MVAGHFIPGLPFWRKIVCGDQLLLHFLVINLIFVDFTIIL